MNPFQESQAQIRIRCPQCGGDIGFLEESHAIRCEFCGTSLIVAGRDGTLRYVLPNRLEAQIEAEAMALEHLRSLGRIFAEPKETFLFYAPFWRLQGQAYRWVFGAKPMKLETEEGVPPPMEKMKVLLTRILDHTIPGYSDLDLGISSLGIRSQAIQLQPFNQEHEKRKNSFLSLSVPLLRAREEAEGAANIFFEGEDLVSEVILQSLVGRVFSVVYFPIWLADCQHSRGRESVLIDGLGKRVLCTTLQGAAILSALKDDGKEDQAEFGQLRFLPLLCPNCGWAFSFQPFNILHFCTTCRRLWKVQGGDLVEADYQVVSSPRGGLKETAWVPFWRCRGVLESEGIRFTTMADFYRLAPPQRVVDQQKESRRPIYFYIPAVKFRNPQVLHTLGSRLTFLQPDLQTEPFPDGSNPPAAGGSLPDRDARELGSMILGSMVPQGNRKARAWLKNCKINLEDPQIFFFPFSRADLFWKELNTGIAFQHNAFPGNFPPERE
jgi:hypothetical protein